MRSGEETPSEPDLPVRSPRFPLLQSVLVSATTAGWASVALRGLNLFVILPYLLRRLAPSEMALWYVFATVISLVLILLPALTLTFSRQVALAMGGTLSAQLSDLRNASRPEIDGPNEQTLADVWSAMRRVFGWMAAAAPAAMLIGTLAVYRPISVVPQPLHAWGAWAVVVVASATQMWGDVYSAWLQGIDRVATVKRREVATSLGTLVTSFITLRAGGGVAAVVVVTQVWLIAGVLMNRAICRRLREHNPYRLPAGSASAVLNQTKGVLWRSMVGVASASGAPYLANLLYAQLASADDVSRYLLAYNLMANVREVAFVPFFTRLPRLSRLRAAGRIDEQRRDAAAAMRLCYATMLLGYAVIGIGAPRAMEWIGSRTRFVSPTLWVLLGVAFMIERFGGMHIHVYSTTNHILWHKANGISGALMIVIALALYPVAGVAAFPLGMAIGYLSFYAWYVPARSYRVMNSSFGAFEASVLLPSAAAFIVCSAAILAWAG